MPLQAQTLHGIAPSAVIRQFADLIAAVNHQQGSIERLQATPPPTIDLNAIKQALGATGAAPMNIFQLLGGEGGAVQVGTHGQRIAIAPATQSTGATFFELDRHAVYVVNATQQWTLVISEYVDALVNRPADLGVNDSGFVFEDTGSNNRWYWNGTGWRWIGGGPTRGTLFPDTKPSGLTSIATGYLFYAIDFDRLYRWTGTIWQDAPGQPTRGQFAFFNNLGPIPDGWALCNGATVRRSTAIGGTQLITVPDLISPGAERFFRTSINVGVTGGAATTHTHDLNVAAGTTGDDTGGGAVVQSGAGSTVAQHPHTHPNGAAQVITTGPPSGLGGDDALPPYYEAQPWFRL